MKAVRVLAKANVLPQNILGAMTLKSVSNSNLPYRTFSNQPPKGPKVPQGNPAQGKVPNPAQSQSKTPVPQQANSLAFPDALKKELYGLISKQAEVLVKEESANELSTQLKQYLDKTGFQLTDNVATGFSLTKETPAMRIYISFEPAEAEEQVDTEDFAEGLQEDAAKEKDIVEEGGEEDAEMEGTKGQKEPNIVVRAEITFLDRTKEPKGVLFIDGFAGYDNRLYVETMMITEDSTPRLAKQTMEDEELAEEMPQGPAIRFDELAQPIQDKMYDLLDSVNIDDNLAAFIRGYLANYPTKNQIEFFDKFKKLLS